MARLTPKMWMVEAFNFSTRDYVPINDVYHNKKDAISVLPSYKKENPKARYRVAKYVRADAARRIRK